MYYVYTRCLQSSQQMSCQLNDSPLLGMLQHQCDQTASFEDVSANSTYGIKQKIHTLYTSYSTCVTKQHRLMMYLQIQFTE